MITQLPTPEQENTYRSLAMTFIEGNFDNDQQLSDHMNKCIALCSAQMLTWSQLGQLKNLQVMRLIDYSPVD